MLTARNARAQTSCHASSKLSGKDGWEEIKRQINSAIADDESYIYVNRAISWLIVLLLRLLGFKVDKHRYSDFPKGEDVDYHIRWRSKKECGLDEDPPFLSPAYFN